ncbi:tail fiber assembly protein [Leclercia pneumoniae]|uniref:tail fiber assembly protein n=1 Tax=Leclercia pneumoniae TaxID=2815358 RepID=UPI003BF5C527
MTFKMSETDQTITIYNLRADTSEFIGKGDAFIPAFTGLPAYCTTVQPPEIKAGFTAVFDFDSHSWKLIEDHRGEVVFSTQTGKAISITEPGDYPPETTIIAPENVWQKWNGKAWVNDEGAERAALVAEADANKKYLISQANELIETLEDAVEFDMVTEDEKQRLIALKKYRVWLNRVNPEHVPDISWPEFPE